MKMEVLELPKAVINFMRSISQEMHRYTLFWDINGTDESVALSLKWKLNINEKTDGNLNSYRKFHKQKLDDFNISTDSSNTDSSQDFESISNGTIKNSLKQKNQTKLGKQMQHFKLDTLRKELTGSLKKSKSSGKFKALSHLSKFDDQCDRPTSKRHLSAESGNTDKSRQETKATNDTHFKARSLSRGRSLDNYEKIKTDINNEDFSLEELNTLLENGRKNTLNFKDINESQNSDSEIHQFNQSHVQEFKSLFQKNYSKSLTRKVQSLNSSSDSPLKFQSLSIPRKCSMAVEKKNIEEDSCGPWVKRKHSPKKVNTLDRNFTFNDANQLSKQQHLKLDYYDFNKHSNSEYIENHVPGHFYASYKKNKSRFCNT